MPTRLTAREREGLWELVADGTSIGVIYTQAAAQWVEAVHQVLPHILVELEDALYQRDLALGRLHRVDRRAAATIWRQEMLQPWTIDLGDIVERMLAAGRMEPNEE